MSAAIYPTSQHQYRGWLKNYVKKATPVINNLQHIVDEFIDDLNNVNDAITYSQIYKFHLKQWNEQCNKIVRMNLKGVGLDREFFANNYDPGKNSLILGKFNHETHIKLIEIPLDSIHRISVDNSSDY